MQKKQAKIDRSVALAARPKKLPFLRRQHVGEKLHVTVMLRRTGWTRWLGGSEEVERTMSLDSMGQEVYEACDGQADVAAIVRRFAARHKISVAEAEAAVTMFLQTLMKKGLVAMAVDRREPKKR